MDVIMIALLGLAIVSAVATGVSKNLVVSVIIFMTYSVIMSIIWVLLQAPDLAITEAAVGAGVSSILFFVTLRKLREMNVIDEDKDEEDE